MEAKRKIEILSTISLTEEQVKQIQALDERIKLDVFKAKEVSRISDDMWRKTEILFTSGAYLPPTEKVPNLRWLHSSYAGVETILDNPLLQQPGLLITNSSGVAISQMGEYVIMMLLNLGHKFPQMIQAQLEKR